MPSILVYHTGALGDFVTILPLLSLLRENYPQHSIALLGRPDTGTLGQKLHFVDSVRDVTSLEFLGLFGTGVSEETAMWIGSFDLAIAFCADNSPVPAHLKACGIKRVIRQPPVPQKPIPIVEYHLSLLQGLERQGEKSTTIISPNRLPPPPLTLSFPTVAIHPGSGSRLKNWPLERFLRVRRALISKGAHVVWIVGPAEEGMRLPEADPRAQGYPLYQLAALLRSCAFSIGNDSGTMHLAAAVGSPCISLFGGSDPRIWAPLGPDTRIIAAGKEIAHHVGQPVGLTSGCMESIPEDRVISECLTLLHRS